ncbi:hypothetical protein CK934_27915 [Chitinophaga sp. MD30]|nr:hypothetical protein CK934_27915 [Chitinophaga sp. MD30]
MYFYIVNKKLSIEFNIVVSETRNVKISAISGMGNDEPVFHVYINNYFQGTIYKRGGRWSTTIEYTRFRERSEINYILNGADIAAIYDLIEAEIEKQT